MFDNLSKKSRRKMLLNVFVYYPLAIIIGVSVGITVLKFMGINMPPALMIIAIVFFIFVAIKHISQNYKGLLKNDESEKGK